MLNDSRDTLTLILIYTPSPQHILKKDNIFHAISILIEIDKNNAKKDKAPSCPLSVRLRKSRTRGSNPQPSD